MQNTMSQQTVVKLTALIFKKDSLSEEEFRYHFTEHAKKAAANMLKHGVIEYRLVSDNHRIPNHTTQGLPWLGMAR